MTAATPEEFMTTAPAPLNGNNTWASRYAAELRHIVHEAAAYQPRSLQKHLGPSEIGSPCDRQVAGKMAGLPATNHVVDPWPSIVGTAVHAWFAEVCFPGWNTRHNQLRFATEVRVAGHPNHPGTGDLYDWNVKGVVDHKVLGDSTLSKIKRAEGPPRKYVVQLLEYGEGFRRLGLPVERVVLAAYPRTRSTLDGLYVWEREHTAADIQLLKEVHDQQEIRYAWAAAIVNGQATLNDIPFTPDEQECYFCPFFRPQSAYDQEAGCPGNRLPKTN